jgi:hypothetical protein
MSKSMILVPLSIEAPEQNSPLVVQDLQIGGTRPEETL